MSLKIFILPTFIILDVIIAIGYIKPNVDAIFATRDEIAKAQDELSRVDTVIGNIQSLTQSIENHSETREFVSRYYPSTLDEERVVDMYNYLAQQSGVIVTEMSVVKNLPARTADALYNEAINSGIPPDQALAQAEATVHALPQTYTAEVSVLGDYSNIKDFFNRIRHADRLQATLEYSIASRERDPSKAEEEAAKGIQSNFLVGTLAIKYPYIAEQQANDVLNMPLFQSPLFDFTAAERAISFVTNPLPALESGSAGRTNPFE